MERRRFYQAMVAKTDANNASKYLPLSMHSRDTAGMMRFLVENWLPDSVKDAIGVSRQELIRLAVFLGGVHDIGKASNAFMVQIAGVFPTAYELLAPLRLSEPRLDNPKLKHHTVIGAAILKEEGAPDWVVSVVGAHHGKTLEPPDFEDVMRQTQNLYGCAENKASWREAWQECLNEALAQAGYESLGDLPEALTQPAQILLTGLLIMADWRASNASLFPLIDADDAIDDRVYPARVEQALAKMRFLSKQATH